MGARWPRNSPPAGATVLPHGRDNTRGHEAIGDIGARTGNRHLVWLRADLASLDEVRNLVGRVAAGPPRFDGLVNNAGISTRPAAAPSGWIAGTAMSSGSPSTIWPDTC